MENSSFVPVKSYIETLGQRSTLLIWTIAGLFAIQLYLTAKHLLLYSELVKVGAVLKYGLWFAIFFEIILLLAVVLLITKKRGDELFFIAGIGLLITIYAIRAPMSPLQTYPAYILGVALSVFGWLIVHPQIKHWPASVAMDADKMYWSYKSLPELAGMDRLMAKQIFNTAAIESKRRSPYLKYSLFGGLGVGAGILLLGHLGMLIASVIYAVWWGKAYVRRTREVLREMGYPEKQNISDI